MPEPTPNPLWSIARVARSTSDADVAIWTVDAVHRQSLADRTELDMTSQHLLADGYELFHVTQDRGLQYLWFKARPPCTSATP